MNDGVGYFTTLYKLLLAFSIPSEFGLIAVGIYKDFVVLIYQKITWIYF
jgi:hypothetical protein